MTPFRRHLLDRCQIAIGSLALVQKEVLAIRTLLTTGEGFVNLEPIRGEEDLELPWSDDQPPIETYESDV